MLVHDELMEVHICSLVIVAFTNMYMKSGEGAVDNGGFVSLGLKLEIRRYT
jgi:hypothetical protein